MGSDRDRCEWGVLWRAVTLTTWADMRAVMDAAEPYMRTGKGRQQAVTSATKSRSKVWQEQDEAVAALSGDVGTGVLPEPDDLTPDPEYVRARNILREFLNPSMLPTRAQASDHLPMPARNP